jgi:hypothetical protein
MQFHKARMRRAGAFAALGFTLILSGCGSNTEWRDYFQMVRAGFKPQKITLSQAAEIPYASLGYKLDGGGQGMLVLATDTNGDQLWTAASHVVLVTRGGRIVRTVGLPHDRAALAPQGAQAMPPLADALKAPYRSARQMDMPDIGAYSYTVSCVTAQRGRELITILGTAMATARVDETCRGSNPGWSFTDSYWLDPDSGFVWRSVQNLHPKGQKLEIEIFRAPE